MTPAAERRLLLVEDDRVVRESLLAYLTRYHSDTTPEPCTLTVTACSTGQEARQRLKEGRFDLVLSDINLPDEDGFTLLSAARQQDPRTQVAMMTAYQVDDYVRLAKQTGVYNIVTKSVPFDFDAFSTLINNLLWPEHCFGLHHYLAPGTEIHERVIVNSDGIYEVLQELRDYLAHQQTRSVDDFATALIEGLTNAVYHAAKRPDGALKYQKGQVIPFLDPCEQVRVRFGTDAHRVGVAICDQWGQLSKQDVLYWLDRNLSGAGLLDTHGRGVYLMHALVDQVVINLAPGHRTELILLNDRTAQSRVNKPLLVYEWTGMAATPEGAPV